MTSSSFNCPFFSSCNYYFRYKEVQLVVSLVAEIFSVRCTAARVYNRTAVWNYQIFFQLSFCVVVGYCNFIKQTCTLFPPVLYISTHIIIYIITVVQDWFSMHFTTTRDLNKTAVWNDYSGFFLLYIIIFMLSLCRVIKLYVVSVCSQIDYFMLPFGWVTLVCFSIKLEGDCDA